MLARKLAGAAAAVATAGAAVLYNGSQVAHAEAPAEKGGKHRVLVIGGGTGGATVAAQLLKRTPEVSVSVVEPRAMHYYQPMWTMVAGHLGFKAEDSERPMGDIIPKGAEWHRDSVAAFHPEDNKVKLASGKEITYDSLVVSTGIKNDYEKIDGLKAALEDDNCPVGTIYDRNYAVKTDRIMSEVKSGEVLFTQPNCPIKCGGAPQKVMWLREEQWRKEGVRDAITITYLNNLPGMFHVKKYSEILGKMADDKKVQRMHKHDLVKIDKVSKVATFKNQETGALVAKPFDAMHVTPYMSPPDVIKKSPIANETGYIPVNKETLQHVKYPNVFALGDSAGIPTSKTAAAVGSQAPVVVSNLLHASKKETLTAKYDGYSSCPLLVGDKKLVLAEFLWAPELKVNETFPWDQGKPSSLLFYMKKDFFPYVYWNFFVKGSWYGHNAFWRPSSAN